MKEMSPQMHECMLLCWQCRDTCQDTLYNHNLERGGSHIDADNIRVMTDCMEMCQTAANFLRRHSRFASVICLACSEICDACADSCESMGKEHTTIQNCAEICRRCSAACSKVVEVRKS